MRRRSASTASCSPKSVPAIATSRHAPGAWRRHEALVRNLDGGPRGRRDRPPSRRRAARRTPASCNNGLPSCYGRRVPMACRLPFSGRKEIPMKSRITGSRWPLALAACTLVWCAAVVARTAAQQPPPPPPAGQTAQQPPATPPAATPPVTPKKNRFETLDDEEEKTAQKPATAGADQKKKSRFSVEDEEETPQADPNASPYTGSARCVKCHLKQATKYYEGPHARPWDDRNPEHDLGCETCHGAGRKHDLDPGAMGLIRMFTRIPPREATRLCMTCHYK